MKIDKGVPVPPHRNAARSVSPYPFAQMQLGDSIVVPFNGRTLHATISHITYHAKRYTDDHCAAFRVIMRPDPAGEKAAVRCWRVEPAPDRAPVVQLVPQKPASYVHRLGDDTPAPRSGRPGRAK